MVKLGRLINKLSIVAVMIACLYIVVEESKIIEIQKKDINKEVLKSKGEATSKLLKGNVIARVMIEKIRLNKMLVLSNQANMQKNIDLNNVSTTNTLIDNNIVMYGHYTQIKNLVFNRITELKQSDIITLEDMANTRHQYRIIELGRSLNLSKLTDQSHGKYLTIITCTTDFDKVVKYYVKAIRIQGE